MDPTINEKTPDEPRGVVIKLGGATLTGASAAIVLFVFLGLIAAFIVYFKPWVNPSPLWISAALWIFFMAYWNSAAKNSAPTKNSESQESRRFHERLLSASLLLLFIPVPGLGWRFLPAGSFMVPIGVAVHVGFLLLAIWARRHLGRNWSGAIVEKVDHQLIRSGPYRFVRHPIYTAMIGMFIGTALGSGRLIALLAVAIIVFAYWRKIPLEEKRLGETFGTVYEAYRRDSWALIPGLF